MPWHPHCVVARHRCAPEQLEQVFHYLLQDKVLAYRVVCWLFRLFHESRHAWVRPTTSFSLGLLSSSPLGWLPAQARRTPAPSPQYPAGSRRARRLAASPFRQGLAAHTPAFATRARPPHMYLRWRHSTHTGPVRASVQGARPTGPRPRSRGLLRQVHTVNPAHMEAGPDSGQTAELITSCPPRRDRWNISDPALV